MAEEAMAEVGANVDAMRELKGLVALLRSSSNDAVAYAYEALATLQQRVGHAEAERQQAAREAAAAVAAARPSEQLLATEREKRAEAERLAARAEMQVAVSDVKVSIQSSSPDDRSSIVPVTL
jgi:sRNA-binding protein